MRSPRPCILPTQPASLATVLATGFSHQMVRTQVALGRLVRVRHGVFMDAGCWPDDPAAQHLLRARAELVVHPEAAMSHESAALVWGLPHPGFSAWHDALPAITFPADSRRKTRGGAVVHHVGRLPPGQITRDADGYAVTAIARTAVDLAAGRPLPDALVILDSAVRKLCEAMVARPRRTDYLNPRLIAAAREVLREAAQTRRPAGLAGSITLAHPARESPAESISAAHIHLAGLPMPLFQQRVSTRIGVVYPDFLWPDLRLVGECDGADKYRDKNAAVLEKEREQALRDLGFKVVRWLAREIMITPEVVIDRIMREMVA